MYCYFDYGVVAFGCLCIGMCCLWVWALCSVWLFSCAWFIVVLSCWFWVTDLDLLGFCICWLFWCFFAWFGGLLLC